MGLAVAWVASVFGAGAISAQEAVPIFNGRDLEGWTIHGTELWYVEDGELVCESGPDAAYGYLRTNDTYTDFELTLEFRQEADGNSGVFFRSTLDGVIITGWQAEVAPPGLFTGGIYESYGRGSSRSRSSIERFAWVSGTRCGSGSRAPGSGRGSTGPG